MSGFASAVEMPEVPVDMDIPNAEEMIENIVDGVLKKTKPPMLDDLRKGSNEYR